MAHQTDVHQFSRSIKGGNPDRIVVDPNCGKEMKYKDVKHILFRSGESIYFCSKRCENEYIQKSKTAAGVPAA